MAKLGAIFGGKKKPAPLPPLPDRNSAEIEAARKRQKSAERLRKGRSASVLTSSSGVKENQNISRPGARSATLLGD